jgi:UDP-N-acetyl-D-mannosaminuronate dehydrogenase
MGQSEYNARKSEKVRDARTSGAFWEVIVELGQLNHDFAAAVISTDHDSIDYESLRNAVSLVVDTRNVYARQSIFGDNVLKA